MYALHYLCNKQHLKTIGKKTQVLQKQLTQVFIALLVSELTLYSTNPGYHWVCLSTGSLGSFVSSPYTD